MVIRYIQGKMWEADRNEETATVSKWNDSKKQSHRQKNEKNNNNLPISNNWKDKNTLKFRFAHLLKKFFPCYKSRRNNYSNQE